MEVGLTSLRQAHALAPDDVERARALTQQALVITQQLAETDPANLDAQRNLASSYSSLADRLQEARQAVAAVQAAERSLSLVEPLAAHLAEARPDLLRAHQQIGELHLRARDFDRARRHYEQSINLAVAFRADSPRDLFLLREHAVSHERLGRLYATQASDKRRSGAERVAACHQGRAQMEKSLTIWDGWVALGGAEAYQAARQRDVRASLAACD
jgi:tetratricopeptide (TPR) repeat protein